LSRLNIALNQLANANVFFFFGVFFFESFFLAGCNAAETRVAAGAARTAAFATAEVAGAADADAVAASEADANDAASNEADAADSNDDKESATGANTDACCGVATNVVVDTGSGFGAIAGAVFNTGSGFGAIAGAVFNTGSGFGAIAGAVFNTGSGFGAIAGAVFNAGFGFGTTAGTGFETILDATLGVASGGNGAARRSGCLAGVESGSAVFSFALADGTFNIAQDSRKPLSGIVLRYVCVPRNAQIKPTGKLSRLCGANVVGR
jgi:hypothetical protein